LRFAASKVAPFLGFPERVRYATNVATRRDGKKPRNEELRKLCPARDRIERSNTINHHHDGKRDLSSPFFFLPTFDARFWQFSS
jgi:hypothetical protein